MTGATEAKLAREAEISYATIAMVTDYDCWHEEHGAVDVAAVIKVMGENANKASAVVARTLREFPSEHEACPIGSDRALEYALITHPSHRDPDLVKKLDADRRTGAARRLSRQVPSLGPAAGLRLARLPAFKHNERAESDASVVA